LFIKETPRQHEVEAAEPVEKPSAREIMTILLGALRQSPALTMTIGGGVAFHFILGAASFEQLWFVQERGFDRSEIAELTGWIALAGGILGNLFGGAGGDAFLRKTGIGRPMFLFWIMLVLTPLTIAYRFVDPASLLFMVGIFLGYFQLGCFYGPTFSTVQELVPPQIRGTLVAFYILSLNFVGLGIGVTGAGYAIDWMANAGVAEPYTITLVIFSVISALAIPLFYFAGRRFAKDRAALYASVN